MLPIEFNEVKNGTQLDVLIVFDKNLGIWGEELPRDYDECVFTVYTTSYRVARYTLICYVEVK